MKRRPSGLLFCFKPSARTHLLGIPRGCYNKNKAPVSKSSPSKKEAVMRHKALWLLAALLIIPHLTNGVPYQSESKDTAGSNSITAEELQHQPASSQKDSPRLPCAGQAAKEKLSDMARLESTSPSCPDEGAIKRHPLAPSNIPEPGRPLRFE